VYPKAGRENRVRPQTPIGKPMTVWGERLRPLRAGPFLLSATCRYTARDGLNWMDWALHPYAVLPGFNLTRPRPA
jgi:hypothetical protein